MLDNRILWSLALRIPALFTGRSLHHAALHASAAGAWNTAEGLFERAAAHYRMDLAVEPLARLRIHQLVTRARAAGNSAREADLLLESAQRLVRLDRIESFDPPFELIPARDLFETGSLRGNPHSAAGVPLHDAA